MKFNHLVNVIDLESTCWEPPETQPQDEMQEIIEVGIAVVDIKKLSIVSNKSILVKPQQSKVSLFCTKLTTLTQEMVDAGISFDDACKILKGEFDASKRTWVSWGDFDRKMFEKNCEHYNIQYPFGPRHLNLKNCFTMLHGLDREPGMDSALDHLKLKLDGTHHRGCWDALNIAKIFVHTLEKFRGISA